MYDKADSFNFAFHELSQNQAIRIHMNLMAQYSAYNSINNWIQLIQCATIYLMTVAF